MSLPPDFSAEQNPYQAPVINDINQSDDEIIAEPASPWTRIGAVLINGLLNIIAISPLFYAHEHIEKSNVCFSLSMILLFGLALLQMIDMAQRGQSIGKHVMKIKVIVRNGEKIGYGRVVLVREIIFVFIAIIIANILIVLLVSNHFFVTTPNEYPFIPLYCIPYFICLLMLFFPKNSRRTLQDYLANTLVVKA